MHTYIWNISSCIDHLSCYGLFYNQLFNPFCIEVYEVVKCWWRGADSVFLPDYYLLKEKDDFTMKSFSRHFLVFLINFLCPLNFLFALTSFETLSRNGKTASLSTNSRTPKNKHHSSWSLLHFSAKIVTISYYF